MSAAVGRPGGGGREAKMPSVPGIGAIWLWNSLLLEVEEAKA